MRQFRKAKTLLLVTLIFGVAATVADAAPASAGTYSALCGSSYQFVKAKAIVDTDQKSKPTIGVLNLYRIRNTSEWCAITVKGVLKGQASTVGVYLVASAKGHGVRYDLGQYKYYAGPIKLTDACPTVGGTMGYNHFMKVAKESAC